MKTFVVLSDSHGRMNVAEKFRALFAENDYIVHLGDGSTDMRSVFGEYPEKTVIFLTERTSLPFRRRAFLYFAATDINTA